MPSKEPASRAAAGPATKSDAGDAPATPVDALRDQADALLRAALECCRQHDRFARLLARGHVESEEDTAQELCGACDKSLDGMIEAYSRASAAAAGARSEPWWRSANALWMAAREYGRHHAGCDALTRKLAKHDASRLGALHLDFELEASALLALRQACDEYCKTRPDAR